ncbi:MAG: 3-deoxy-manno-octulosonate cytidylyltransferase, partial [bacterium]
YQHIGIYGYTSDVLKKITKLPISSLEQAESLEQLRWLENGYKIKTAVTTFDSIAIDCAEDVEKVLIYLKN